MRPVLLDAFCGAGGAAVGYHRAGFDVVGVDHAPQPRYPFAFEQADALEFVGRYGHEFDAIHASPPCQAYLGFTGVNRQRGRQPMHADLIRQTRLALEQTGRPWAIENVPGAPLKSPVRLCGSSFRLLVRRHRLFESPLSLLGLPCDHGSQGPRRFWTSWRPNGQRRLSAVVQVYGNGGDVRLWRTAMGISWMNKAELSQAVPPAYTAFIDKQLIRALDSSTGAADARRQTKRTRRV